MVYYGDGSNLTGVSGIPAGGIIMWSGATNAIPSGWVICDGNNSTPDLRNRFVVGAGDSYAVDATGGADSVTLTVDQIPAHTHTWDRQDAQNDVGYRPWPASNNDCKRTTANTGDNTHSHTISGNTGDQGGTMGQSFSILPPYYALCYIMKL